MNITDFKEGFQENDEQRSAFIKMLLNTEPRKQYKESRFQNTIPKILVRYWHDLNDIPDDVSECLKSWESLRNSGFKIITFYDDSATRFIESHYNIEHIRAFRRCHHPAMRSDYFRLCYVLQLGGFYVDADDVMTGGEWKFLYENDRLKLQPLCYNIATSSMESSSTIWKAALPDRNLIFYANNNPLVAPPGHPIVRKALDRATKALLHSNQALGIQSTTGPGNLTATLAGHARVLLLKGKERDFSFMRDWHRLAATKWDLSYRNDARNWRNIRNYTRDSEQLLYSPSGKEKKA